ncbi:MAG TPA: glutathione S-transferase [Rhizomicrobium sp.]|nr:glutathione S-transferase [Rhizomicrobium sp.]
MITLYHAPRSRSSMIVWLLEELGQPYRINLTPIVYGDGTGAPAPESYRAIHPHKKVPAIDHDGVKVFECAGIATYIADRFPEANLAPKPDDPKRGLYASLMAYWAGPMNAIATARMHGWDKDQPTGFGSLAEMEAWLDKLVAEADPWILGRQFTAADVLYAAALNFYMMFDLLPKKPAYVDYTARANERPAAKRAQERDNG